MIDWASSRVLVTGGAGFLGSFVVERLRARGVEQVFVPRKKDYDLVDGNAVRRLLADTKPTLVVHPLRRWAASERTGTTGPVLLRREHDDGRAAPSLNRATGVRKFVGLGTVCAYRAFVRCLSARTICGMAIRKKPTRLMG
jgi:GDP-L-fucose synthase